MPPEVTGKCNEHFDAIASLFPDKGLTGAEVQRRLVTFHMLSGMKSVCVSVTIHYLAVNNGC